MPPVSRRVVLGAGATSAALLGVGARPSYAADLPAFPFTLGVASGDPRHNAVTLWTRLAPEPLVPGFGMDERDYVVEWEVATDEGLSHVVRRGTALAEIGRDHVGTPVNT